MSKFIIFSICVLFPALAFAGPATYQYDSVERLTRSVNADGAITTYTYDAEGNRMRLVRSTGPLDTPQAAFDADTTEGDAPLQVHFTDQSSGIVESWTWDFGDDETSDEQNPVHTYASPGTYTVTLTAANRDTQQTATQTDLITVRSSSGPRPTVSVSHGFATGYDGTIDFNCDLNVGFRITLENSGEEDTVVDVSVTLADNAFVMVMPPQNCLYDPGTKTFENIPVPAGERFEIDYIAKYQGTLTANGDSIVNSAAIRRIAAWYDAVSGLDRGGYTNLSAAATATVSAQSMVLGTVRDMTTGQNIFSAAVTATSGKNTATNTQGFYRLLLSPGVYSVSIAKSGYQTASLSTVIVYSNRATFLNVDLTTPGVLAISTTAIDDGLVGQDQNPKIKITGGVYPYTYSLVSGTLPPGVILDTANGNLSGTPNTAGDYTFTIGVRDKNNAYAERQFTQTVGAPLNFETASDLPRVARGTAYCTYITAGGGTPPYTYTLVGGALPAGIQLSENGEVSGIPNTPDQQYFTVRVDDTAGGTASRDFSLGVDEPLAIETDRLFSGVVGKPFSQDLQAAGGYGDMTWSVTAGGLPSDLLLQNGTLTGTPLATASGSVTLRLSDAAGRTVQKEFPWEVDNPLTLVTPILPPAYKDRPYEETLAISGGIGTVAFSCLSPLPPGLTLHSETGIISGTTSIAGLSNVVIRITDQAYPEPQAVEKTFSFLVADELKITTDTIQDVMMKEVYEAPLVAKGGFSPYSWNISEGTLPEGVVIDPQTGVLSGTPIECGTFDFTVKVADSAQVPNEVAVAYSLTVACCESCFEMGGNVGGMQGIQVHLSGAGTGTVDTDAEGRFRFTGLSAGSYTVTPVLDGYWMTPSSREVNIQTRDAAGVDFTVRANAAPQPAANPNLADGIGGVALDASLAWIGADPDAEDTLRYTIRFGTTAQPSEVATGQISAGYAPGPLLPNTTYYWQIVTIDAHGLQTEGPVWQFRTLNRPPATPCQPSPVDEQDKVPQSVVLAWVGGDPDPDDAVMYDVYFGTVADPPLAAAGHDAASFDPGRLDTNRPYYWKIVSQDSNGGVTEGPVWSFTTVNPGEIQFSAINYTVVESAGIAAITISRANGSQEQVLVDYATIQGTAKPDLDYLHTVGTLVFEDGETAKTFNVPLVDDLRAEPEESVGLFLSNPRGGATLGAVAAATLTIMDDAVDVMAGDVNNDKVVDLADLILALQVVSHSPDLPEVFPACEINEDGTIGIEEVLYILQFISGTRAAHVWP